MEAALSTVAAPRVERLVRVVDVDAHEGPVYVAGEDALYFTTLPRRDDAGVPQVAIKRVALDGERFPLERSRVTVVCKRTRAANGMTLDRDGALLACEQGTLTEPAGIVRVDRATGVREVVIDGFNSPNDVCVGPDGAIWFTDPGYGHLQGFRPAPAAPDAVYRFDRDTGELAVVSDAFEKPNGIALSPDASVLYVTDSGANQEPGSFYANLPHHVVALELGDGADVRYGRVLADIAPGFPDGLKVDADGRVYVSSAAGVQVYAPDGTPLTQIDLPGAVNFTFGGPRRNVLYITADDAIWAAVLDATGPAVPSTTTPKGA